MERITSRQNETVRRHAKLHSASARREQGLFLCEGARLCADAARSGAEIAVCYVTDRALEKYAEYCTPLLEKAKRSFVIGEHVAELLSDTKNPQGVYCVCEIAQKDASLPEASGRYLALENMQDPANLGTVLRTAEALGVSGVLLSDGCCDVYGGKVLRGSMGAVFRLPLYRCGSMDTAISQLNKRGFETMAAVVSDPAEDVTKVEFSAPCAVVIGNEGNGLTDETIHACTKRVTIPMAGRAESLNASAATSILLWEMMRGGTGDG